MKRNALVLALIAAATGMPGTVHAADDVCSRLFIYTVNQMCQLLANGQKLCQPIGIAGPAPNCQVPGQLGMVQVPLGPPTLQLPTFNPATNTYNPNPYLPNPFAMNPYGASPYGANPFAANSYGVPAFPFAPGAFPSAVNYTAPQFPAQLPHPLPQFPQLAAPVVPSAPQIVSAQAPVDNTDAPPVIATTVESNTPVLTKLMPETDAPTIVAEVLSSKAQNTEVQSTGTQSTVAPEVPAVARVPEAAQATANLDVPQSHTSQTEVVAVVATEATPAEIEKAQQNALAHFDFDSAELTPVGRAMLDEWLTQASSETPLLVTGHADRLGPEPYNNKLSQLRAEAVKKYLVDKGMPATHIQIQAKGQHMPLISCVGDANPETKSCLAPNRRAEVTLKPAAKPAAKATGKSVSKSTKAKVTAKVAAKKPAKIKQTKQIQQK